MNLGKFFAYVTTAILVGLAFWFWRKKQYKRATIYSAFWLVPLLLAISFGKDLRIEQWICWGFAVAFLYYSHKLLRENHIGYAFVTFLISAFVFFFGLTSVQTLLKTHLLWQVTDSLKSYGEKLDTFQTTVTDIRQGLEQQQITNEVHQSELTRIQVTLRQGVKEVASQQNDITNQYQKLTQLNAQLDKLQGSITNQFQHLASLETELTTAQTNLLAQQAKLGDVEYLVQNLYANLTSEEFTLANTNDTLVFGATNGSFSIITRLSHVPIQKSVRFKFFPGGFLDVPTEYSVQSTLYDNIFLCGTWWNYNSNTVRITVEYVIDARNTNVHQTIPNRENFKLIGSKQVEFRKP